MRSCDAVGIQEIFILNTRIPRHKKWGARSSSSAEKWLTVHQFSNAEECFREVRQRFGKIYTTHLAEGAKDLYSLDLTEPVALVFGNEHSGVSEEILPFADGNFLIPQFGIIRSLNISVACAVSIYEALRQKRIAGHYDHPRMQEASLKQLEQTWGLYQQQGGTSIEE